LDVIEEMFWATEASCLATYPKCIAEILAVNNFLLRGQLYFSNSVTPTDHIFYILSLSGYMLILVYSESWRKEAVARLPRAKRKRRRDPLKVISWTVIVLLLLAILLVIFREQILDAYESLMRFLGY
jgi:hypothetical protein